MACDLRLRLADVRAHRQSPFPPQVATKLFARVHGCVVSRLIGRNMPRCIMAYGQGIPRLLQAVDGILLVTPESWEPEAVAAAKSWFAETGRGADVSLSLWLRLATLN